MMDIIVSHAPEEECGFWRAIAAAPEDKLPRLIYSDWLLDRGANVEAYEQRKLAGVPCEELRQLIA